MRSEISSSMRLGMGDEEREERMPRSERREEGGE
jgi:hypothetical protein